jgi:glycosyltransferase involved in cell wall biosynthesis
VTEQPTASIVIPTRRRPGYLDVTLASVTPQARAAGAEVIVVNDGGDTDTDLVSQRHGARVLALTPPGGANAGRNAGIGAARSDLIVLIDDDIYAPGDWLAAILAGAEAAPHAGVFGGPIRARLEGTGLRSCGREPVPITTLDHGDTDREGVLVWSANMAIRRRALDLAGLFDPAISGRGEEEDWERRYIARGGIVRYLAAAGLEHRRAGPDSTLSSLARAAYGHGRGARRYDVRKGAQPSLAGELRTLVGCAWHTVRRRCANGIVLAAHSTGRLREALTRAR